MASREELSALAKSIVSLGVEADMLELPRVRDSLDLAFMEVRRVYQDAREVGDVLENGVGGGAGGSPGDAR